MLCKYFYNLDCVHLICSTFNRLPRLENRVRLNFKTETLIEDLEGLLLPGADSFIDRSGVPKMIDQALQRLLEISW